MPDEANSPTEQGPAQQRGYQPHKTGSRPDTIFISEGYQPKGGGPGKIVKPPSGAIAGDVPAAPEGPGSQPGGTPSDSGT